jgi:hypothetical protein
MPEANSYNYTTSLSIIQDESLGGLVCDVVTNKLQPWILHREKQYIASMAWGGHLIFWVL